MSSPRSISLLSYMHSCNPPWWVEAYCTSWTFFPFSSFLREYFLLFRWMKTVPSLNIDYFFLSWLLTVPAQASIAQEWIWVDSITCCHTEIEAANQICCLVQLQDTEIRPASPSTVSQCQAYGMVATRLLMLLVGLNYKLDPRHPAVEVDTLFTWPSRRSWLSRQNQICKSPSHALLWVNGLSNPCWKDLKFVSEKRGFVHVEDLYCIYSLQNLPTLFVGCLLVCLFMRSCSLFSVKSSVIDNSESITNPITTLVC